MPAVQRQGDKNDAGAAIIGGLGSVRVNNLPVSVDRTAVVEHGKGTHASPQTSRGNPTVKAGNVPINTAGNPDTCGHIRMGGSPDVRIG